MTVDGRHEPSAAALVAAEDDLTAKLRSRAQEAIGLAQQLQDVLGQSRAVGDHERERGLELRAQAAAVRAGRATHTNLLVELQDEVAGLRKAMETRATIEQAKGILMAAEHCTPEEAFDVLVRASQRENRKLAVIAAGIVERTVTHPHGEGRGRDGHRPQEGSSSSPKHRAAR